MNFRNVMTPTSVSNHGVANQIVQVGKVVQFDGELTPKGIVVLNGVVSLLVQAIDINVGRQTIALSFRVWEPRLSIATEAGIVNGRTTFAEWTGRIVGSNKKDC